MELKYAKSLHVNQLANYADNLCQNEQLPRRQYNPASQLKCSFPRGEYTAQQSFVNLNLNLIRKQLN